MMQSILAIVGSSAFVAIVTLMFNWVQNRKQNSLSYITEERKLWREKIRKIAAHIEKCDYNGKNKKNIRQYLIQLEMNINPYGRTLSFDYLQDGHIWKAIDEFMKSDSAERFEQNKELLLSYLSLMLKEDWERSKREVNGYSKALIYIVVIGIVSVVYYVFYFYVLKLENIEMFIILQTINLSPLFFIKYFCIDEMYKATKNDNGGKFRDFCRREKEATRAVFSWGVLVVIYVLVNVCMLELVYPDMIVQQMHYDEDADWIIIYTDLDEKLWGNLETDFEKTTYKKAIIDKTGEWHDHLYRNETYDDLLVKIIRKHIIVLGMLPLVFVMGTLFVPFLIDIISNDNQNKSKREIDELKYRIQGKYVEDYNQIRIFLDRVDWKNSDKKKENKDCIDLIYRLLFKMRRAMKSELCELDDYFCNSQEYETVQRLQRDIDTIDTILHQIKHIHRAITGKSREKLLNKIRKNIDNISYVAHESEM